MDKSNLFKRSIVPVETVAGTMYIRSLNVAEDISVNATKDIRSRLALQICDENGDNVFTKEDLDKCNWVELQPIVNAIVELNNKYEKKV